MAFFRAFSSKIFASKLNATKLATAVGFGAASGFALFSGLSHGTPEAKTVLAAEAEPLIQPSKFTPFKLKEVETVNHNTSIFRFALPSEDQTLELPTASCIVVGFTTEEGTLIVRSLFSPFPSFLFVCDVSPTHMSPRRDPLAL